MSHDGVFEVAWRATEALPDRLLFDDASFGHEMRSFFLDGDGTGAALRRLIEGRHKAPRRLLHLESLDPDALAWADRAWRCDEIAAFDGAFVMPRQDLPQGTVCAMATGVLSSWSGETSPDYKLSCTRARHAVGGAHAGEGGEDDLLDDLLTGKRALNEDRSWPNTLLEFLVRERALASSYPVRIIDGPLFTQNLMTQQKGREQLAAIAADPAMWIGVIKNLSFAVGAMEPVSQVLRDGEVFICDYVGRLYEYRESNPHVIRWTKEHIGPASGTSGFVRAVYRPRGRALGFECRLDDLERALAVITAWPSDSEEMATPFILSAVDADLRAMCADRYLMLRSLEADGRTLDEVLSSTTEFELRG